MNHLAALTELGQSRRGLGMLPPVHSVYQPIVDLRTGDTVAFEALARGPRGTEWELPEALFADARRHGVEAALDWECRAAAMSGALRRRLPASVPLFVNAEPDRLDVPVPAHVAGVVEQATERLQLVVEVTERELVRDPAGLIASLERMREDGWGVALDDVGADPAALSLLPLLEPDVIKLDLGLLAGLPGSGLSTTVNAVLAQAERSGAIVLVERIETAQHLDQALAMGATLGQGWLLGRPGPLPAEPAPAHHDLAFTRPAPIYPVTPFELVSRRRATRTATRGVLLPTSHHLEQHVRHTASKPVLLAALQNADHFTGGTAARYRELSADCSFTGAYGVGMPPSPVPGVHGGDLAGDDPLAGEWVVCVLGPHFSGVLIARDLGDDGPDPERRFEAATSFERDLVVAATRSLLARTARPDPG